MFQPIIGAGYVELPSGKQIRIEHAHLEGDAGKLNHFDHYSLVDLNRADTPLIEIVSMPDLHSARDAHDYCKELWRFTLRGMADRPAAPLVNLKLSSSTRIISAMPRVAIAR